MSVNSNEEYLDEMFEEEEEAYSEPMSLADHQMLVYSARKLVNKARNFIARKRIPRKVIKKKPEVVKIDKVEDGEKIVLAPRDESAPFKIIKMPPKAIPLKPTPIVRKILPRILPSNIHFIKSIPQMSSDPIASTSKAAPIQIAKPLSLTIGNKKICIQPKIMKPKSPLRLESAESSSDETPESHDMNPESFPKAIVYPEIPKEKPPMKIQSVVSKSPYTFSHVFERAAKKNEETRRSRKQDLKATKIVPEELYHEHKKRRTYPTNQVRAVVESTVVLEEVENSNDSNKSEKEFLEATEIPQNMIEEEEIVPEPDETIEIDDDDEFQFEAINMDPNHQQLTPETNFEMPPRPEINTNLMKTLASYRVMARYLMMKKKIQPFSFDSTENEYINVYRTLKR